MYLPGMIIHLKIVSITPFCIQCQTQRPSKIKLMQLLVLYPIASYANIQELTWLPLIFDTTLSNLAVNLQASSSESLHCGGHCFSSTCPVWCSQLFGSSTGTQSIYAASEDEERQFAWYDWSNCSVLHWLPIALLQHGWSGMAQSPPSWFTLCPQATHPLIPFCK